MSAVKLAVTADLHLPITPAERLAALADEMANFAPDAVVLGGDLAESLEDLQRCLELLTDRLSCPIWVVPGNHDLWVRRTSDSRHLWLKALPEVVARAGCHWLEGNAFVLGRTAVVGTIAWYDYSAADPSVRVSALTFAQEKYAYNADALLIDWEWSDPEFASMVAGPFLKTLHRLESDPEVERTVVVTHVPVVEGQMRRNPEDYHWGFSNAYFGNLTLGRRILAARKVTHIISGHTHFGLECTIDRPGAPSVDARVLPCDYENPSWVGLTFPTNGVAASEEGAEEEYARIQERE